VRHGCAVALFLAVCARRERGAVVGAVRSSSGEACACKKACRRARAEPRKNRGGAMRARGKWCGGRKREGLWGRRAPCCGWPARRRGGGTRRVVLLQDGAAFPKPEAIPVMGAQRAALLQSGAKLERRGGAPGGSGRCLLAAGPGAAPGPPRPLGAVRKVGPAQARRGPLRL